MNIQQGLRISIENTARGSPVFTGRVILEGQQQLAGTRLQLVAGAPLERTDVQPPRDDAGEALAPLKDRGAHLAASGNIEGMGVEGRRGARVAAIEGVADVAEAGLIPQAQMNALALAIQIRLDFTAKMSVEYWRPRAR